MPAFQIYFGDFSEHLNSYYIDSIWTSLWASMTGVGQIIGSSVAGPVSQRFGRRWTAMGSGVVTVSAMESGNGMRETNVGCVDCGCCGAVCCC